MTTTNKSQDITMNSSTTINQSANSSNNMKTSNVQQNITGQIVVSTTQQNNSQQNTTTQKGKINESESYINLSGGKYANNLTFGNGEYLLILEDIAIGTGNEIDCGLFRIIYSSDLQEIKRLIICSAQETLWISPKGDSYRIKVVNVAAGYSKNSRWASVIIYS